MKKRWYNLETSNEELKGNLKQFLQQHDLVYEISGLGSHYHIEILLSPEEVKLVNEFLEGTHL